MFSHKENLLQTMVGCDSVYQTLLKQYLDIEPEYLRIRSSLATEDQLILDHYLSLCEEMDHRKLTMALTI